MKRTLLFICLTLLPAGAAYANTFVFINNNPYASGYPVTLVSSTPGPNQQVDSAPGAVILTFSGPIRADGSSIKVYDLYGTEVNDGNVTVNNNAMSANLPPLAAGRYAVKWKTRCQCGDPTQLGDEFHFTIR